MSCETPTLTSAKVSVPQKHRILVLRSLYLTWSAPVPCVGVPLSHTTPRRHYVTLCHSWVYLRRRVEEDGCVRVIVGMTGTQFQF
jgi:hypothetical protein